MGIKGLWTVLAPFSEKKSLHEIRGETIAIDLSGWVCDSQNVTDYHIQPRLYLRNLFFRTIYLLLADVKPIFVLEGDAPELKRDVMAARNAIQFKGAAPKSSASLKKKPDVSRKRFKGVLRECELLLQSMGVACIKGEGEAEATCAVLNSQGIVDAVVSQDSDCFAYGARKVYRNFSVSNSAGGGALQGSVDCYDADLMIQKIGFGRNKMIALAMLCGCDYSVGACGSSVATVISYLCTLNDNDVIPRLLSWVSDPEQYEEKQRWLAIPGRCNQCGHIGRNHGKSGCFTCTTNKGCNDTGYKTKVANTKRELSLRNRAVTCGLQFPEPKIMKEFLNVPEINMNIEDLHKSIPSLVEFIKIMRTKLDWTEKYCVEKFLPLLTRCHLQDIVPCRSIQPSKINKKRNPRGVPSYEVVWSDISGQYEGLIPDDQFEEEESPESPWTTIERQDLMKLYYPDIVETYEESIKKPPKKNKVVNRKPKNIEDAKKPKRKYNKKKIVKDIDVENIRQSLSNVNISCNKENKLNVSVKINKLKRKLKENNNKSKTQKTIDYFLPKRRKSYHKLLNSLRNSSRHVSVDKEAVEEKFNLSPVKNISLFNLSHDELAESDLSDIIDKIVNDAPKTKVATVNNEIVKLVFTKNSTPIKSVFRNSILQEIKNNSSTPKQSPVRNKSLHKINSSNISNFKMNTSYFFDKFTEECDAFEMSFDRNNDLNSEDTINYSLHDYL